MLLDMNKPNPVPFSDFVANLVNSLGIISEAIPRPESFILTITSSWLTSFFFSSKTTAIDPPSSSGINLTALFSKLEIT